MAVELKDQLRAISQMLAGEHAGLSSPIIDALSRAAMQLKKRKGKSGDLAARLQNYARDLKQPGEINLDDLIATLNKAADRV